MKHSSPFKPALALTALMVVNAPMAYAHSVTDNTVQSVHIEKMKSGGMFSSSTKTMMITQTDTVKPTAHVALKGDTLIYQGAVNKDDFATLKSLYDTAKTKPKTLHINSIAGDDETAMHMGDWVAEKSLNIRVTNSCTSVCANYIFPVAKTKYLGQFATLAWQGITNHAGGMYIKRVHQPPKNTPHKDLKIKNIKNMDGSPAKNLSKEDLAKIKQEIMHAMAETKSVMKMADMQALTSMQSMEFPFSNSAEIAKKATAFYKKHGLNPKIATLTQGDSKWAEKLKSDPMTVGWTYTPAVLAKLGVKNVVLMDKQWMFQDNPKTARTPMGMKLVMIDNLQ